MKIYFVRNEIHLLYCTLCLLYIYILGYQIKPATARNINSNIYTKSIHVKSIHTSHSNFGSGYVQAPSFTYMNSTKVFVKTTENNNNNFEQNIRQKRGIAFLLYYSILHLRFHSFETNFFYFEIFIQPRIQLKVFFFESTIYMIICVSTNLFFCRTSGWMKSIHNFEFNPNSTLQY